LENVYYQSWYAKKLRSKGDVFRAMELMEHLGYEFTHSNDAPRGGAEGNFYRLDSKRKIKFNKEVFESQVEQILNEMRGK